MKSRVARFALRHALAINFIALALCAGGGYAALHMPSAVFPQTDFPRVIIIVNNGVMPAREMMATITRPIEESMKEIPGCKTVRSSTGRGTAEIDVFFSWDVDMTRSELYVLSHLAQVRGGLPASATTDVYRMNFSVFPIIGMSLTGGASSATAPWELARYQLQSQILRIPGVARVELLGGQAPEYTVIADPLRLAALHLSLTQLFDNLAKNTVVAPTGVHEENHSLYLAVVDGRVHDISEIENLNLATANGKLVPLKDVAHVERGAEPSLQVVTAGGEDAVLLNIYSQPDASTVDIADHLQAMLPQLRGQLPPGMKLTFFYDQSLFVRASLRGVWDAIIFGLILSILILLLFLRNAAMTLVAIVVIPITVLVTILALKVFGQSFNLMTLGGVAAAIGLVIDDAIVVVEAICARMNSNLSRRDVIDNAMSEILPPLLGSTLTPVVVFIPLAFLTGIAGVFFRALALTMVIALLASLALAVTIIPSLAAWMLAATGSGNQTRGEGGFVFRWILGRYQRVLELALRNRWFTVGLSLIVLLAAGVLYTKLQTDFLPAMDEGGFIIDYVVDVPGISLAESDRQMRQAEAILLTIPEVESFSRRTGTALGVHLDEPNTGDFLVKLKPDRRRSSEAIIADVRQKFREALPKVDWEFPGILTDLIGDLTWSDEQIEIKVFSTDAEMLKQKAHDIDEALEQVRGVVDTFSGLVMTGPTISLRVRDADALRQGLTTSAIADEVNIAMLGRVASTVMEADNVVNIRVKDDPQAIDRVEKIRQIPLRNSIGQIIRLQDVADVVLEPGQMELHRDDLRQDIAVTARLQDRDLGGAMRDVQEMIGRDPSLNGIVEYGGLYAEQQESFRNLSIVLITALVLVFLVALIEFRSFYEPISIVFGAALSLLGIVLSLLITGTTLNIVAFLGAIIGMGIVHKNGLLMLDAVKQLLETGTPLAEALVQAGRRRLRPVLMTSMAAALGMLPLAWGFGSAGILKPLAVTVIGAVCVSVLLSLVATPTVYYLLRSAFSRRKAVEEPT